MSDTPSPPRVVVLGGGSAGWITACLLHDAWGGAAAAGGGSVTVVESPEIGIIGVGEGSTPQLKAFFDQICVAEHEWMSACDATYKLGIRFTGWSERPGFESYFHPFPGPIDQHSEPAFVRNAELARRGLDVPVHPDGYYLAGVLAAQGKAPQPAPSFPFAPSYGYHFDAFKLGAFLRDHAVAKGVTHLPRTVIDVELSENGDVAALLCDDGERIMADVFVDCSGFRSIIAQQALKERFIPFAENLFNDRAVVLPTDHSAPFRPQTESVAMGAGWRWAIPLTSRIGNGYVYSSAHISDDEAEAELRSALAMENSDVTARTLHMKVGRVEKSWTGNCLVAGLAQGFIEPLEATALHIVISTALEFAQAFEAGGFTPKHRDQFNRNAAARYDAIRDYIVAHYRLNQRSDTAYWRENAANQRLSDSLKAMITAWFTNADIAQANSHTYDNPAYSAGSWHCLFAGYGTFPASEKMQKDPAGMGTAESDRIAKMLAACSRNFKPITS